MKKSAFKSVRTLLTFGFLFNALIPQLISLIATYNQLVNDAETRTFDKLTTIRNLKVEQLLDWITERIYDVWTEF